VVPLTFQQLGRSFEPGQVTMRVRVFRGHGHLFAAADRELELTRSYPNGKDCDGDGWVTGYLDLTAADRVRP
jgi:hypothetical protein